MTGAKMRYGKNKVLFFDVFSNLEPFGTDNMLYVVRYDNALNENVQLYEWRNDAYHQLEVKSFKDNETAIMKLYQAKYQLPTPANARSDTLYIVLNDESVSQSTTMYVFVNGEYALVTALNGANGAQNYVQHMQMGVIATTDNAKSFTYIIPYTPQFLRAPIEVLCHDDEKWCAAVHGRDYDYEYPNPNHVIVTFYRDGDYKVNV